MFKWKHREALSGKPIAGKLVAGMKRRAQGKMVDLGAIVNGRAAADKLQDPVAAREDLAALHPAHAAYVYALNQVSVMSEQLTAMREMEPFVDIVSKAEDLYMPSSPPMSPLTDSYFTCWCFFDACAGAARETIGSAILEVGAAFGMDAELLRLIRLMQKSRMGLYVHKGRESGLAVLEELVTGAVCRAIVPAGYLGRKDELWYVRVLPPPVPGGSEHVVFITPYIILQPGTRDWLAYFSRTLSEQARVADYERHMKFGPTRSYWNDFIFEAYVNYRMEAIYLTGLPDVPESRPHSEVNQWGFGGDVSAHG
ncbi:MAG: hypothetical protein ABSG03_09635 [Bryobacteraceae bacterium]|jgi:hypothetical protein